MNAALMRANGKEREYKSADPEKLLGGQRQDQVRAIHLGRSIRSLPAEPPGCEWVAR